MFLAKSKKCSYIEACCKNQNHRWNCNCIYNNSW